MLGGLFNSVDDRDGVAISALLEDGNIHRMLAINAHDVGLNGARILGFTNVANHHGSQPNGFDGEEIDLRSGGDLTVGVDVVVHVADAHVTGRQDQVGFVNRLNHIEETELMGFQFDRVDKNLDLPVCAAERLRHRGALHVGNLVAYLKLGQILEACFV